MLMKKTNQKGIALFITLMILVIVTILGVSIARTQFAGEIMARNAENHAMATQAAEAALRDAEANLLQDNFVDFPSNSNGLYQFDPTAQSAYLGINWSNPAANTTKTYGSAPLASPSLSNINLAAQPKYIVEQLPPVAIPGENISSVQYGLATIPVVVYRVTAYGVGGDTSSNALLQSIFR